jgi:signal transduction histidine kinase
MQYRHRLRSRIILSFLLLGFGLTALFALASLLLRSQMEDELVESWLRREAVSFLEFKRENPQPDAPYSLSAQGMEFSIFRPDSPRIPLEWRDLSSGVHDLVDPALPGREGNYKLVVERDPDMVAFLRYSYGSRVLDKQQMYITLGVSMVMFTLLAFLVGVWSSRRVMKPVSHLAGRIRAYRGSGLPEKLAPRFADDEVGELAEALDEYAERLTERVQRDREFNADVSHELRTPLAVIRGATELMLCNSELPPKMRQRLERIARAEQQCTNLITALLMLSRNERGTGVTDVRQLAEQLAEANRIQMAGKPVEICVEGEAVAEVPEAVMSVALGNLLGNACKYTAEGVVTVRIFPHEVRIEDTGPGLSAEDASRLFERGYRGAAAGSTKGGGIGLSIVSRLCELYGWSVSIAPREPKGAVATLRFGEVPTVAAPTPAVPQSAIHQQPA